MFITPGEDAAARCYNALTSLNTTPGVLASEISAAVVMEHRYWETLSPFAGLTTEDMKHLTLKISIADFTNFAKNARLPFNLNSTSTVDNAPWVMVGGSYSDALSAWTAAIVPGIFWAYHASSAPVESISDYWAYYNPIQQGMPKKCGTDVTLVIDHVDKILDTGTEDQKYALREISAWGHYKTLTSAPRLELVPGSGRKFNLSETVDSSTLAMRLRTPSTAHHLQEWRAWVLRKRLQVTHRG